MATHDRTGVASRASRGSQRPGRLPSWLTGGHTASLGAPGSCTGPTRSCRRRERPSDAAGRSWARGRVSKREHVLLSSGGPLTPCLTQMVLSSPSGCHRTWALIWCSSRPRHREGSLPGPAGTWKADSPVLRAKGGFPLKSSQQLLRWHGTEDTGTLSPEGRATWRLQEGEGKGAMPAVVSVF